MRQFRTIPPVYDDDATIKRAVVNAPTVRIPSCQGFEPMGAPCGAIGDLVEFVYSDGRKRQFCRLHHATEAHWEVPA